MKPRGSLPTNVLSEGETQLEGSADLGILHKANGRGTLFSGREISFSKKNVFEEGNFQKLKIFETYVGIFEKMGL